MLHRKETRASFLNKAKAELFSSLSKDKVRFAEGTALVQDLREPAKLGVSFSYCEFTSSLSSALCFFCWCLYVTGYRMRINNLFNQSVSPLMNLGTELGRRNDLSRGISRSSLLFPSIVLIKLHSLHSA